MDESLKYKKSDGMNFKSTTSKAIFVVVWKQG